MSFAKTGMSSFGADNMLNWAEKNSLSFTYQPAALNPNEIRYFSIRKNCKRKQKIKVYFNVGRTAESVSDVQSS